MKILNQSNFFTINCWLYNVTTTQFIVFVTDRQRNTMPVWMCQIRVPSRASSWQPGHLSGKLDGKTKWCQFKHCFSDSSAETETQSCGGRRSGRQAPCAPGPQWGAATAATERWGIINTQPWSHMDGSEERGQDVPHIKAVHHWHWRERELGPRTSQTDR